MIETTPRIDATWDRPYAGARALVLGGTGFVGRWLVRALAAKGTDVHLTARNVPEARSALAAESTRASVVAADLSRPGVAGDVTDRVAPDVVFNLAVHGVDPSERDPAMMATINTELVKDLCARLLAPRGGNWPGVRLVHVGSALEYGSASGHLGEDGIAVPTTDYGRSKLAGTEHIQAIAQATGLGSVVARLFAVYGPGEHDGRLLPSLQRLARTSGRIGLTSGRQRRDFTYVEDAVEGLLRLAVSPVPPGAVVNVATGALTSVRDFALTAAALLGLDPVALEFGVLPTRPEEMVHDEVDVTRLEALTGWRPRTSVADGLRQSLEREHVRQ